MNRLLVGIYVPAIGSTFDVSIPHHARVFELLPLISHAVERLSNGLFVPNDPALCNGTTGVIYNNNMSVEDMELQNGSRLMLV